MKAKIEIKSASLNKVLAVLVVIELGCLVYFAHSYTSQDKVVYQSYLYLNIPNIIVTSKFKFFLGRNFEKDHSRARMQETFNESAG